MAQNNYKRPVITAGNDFYINITMTEIQGDVIENFDLTKCKSVEVYLICAIHNTKIDLDFEILDTPEHNIIKAFVDHRMLHNTSYGICVEGTYEDDLHFRWFVLPKEGILIIPNTSGQNIPTEVEYVDLAGRVGFVGIDLSDYYTKEETNNLIESKQDTLISGENIKTINNISLLGEGNIDIQGGGTQVQSDWDESDPSSMAYILNKPTIPESPVQSDWNESDTSSLAYIQNKPTIPESPVQSDWNESDTSSLAYIQNKPTIPAAQVNSDWNSSSGASEILNKPYVPYDSYNNILVQGYTGSSIITGNILSGSNSIMGELYNNILGGTENILGSRQFNGWNLNQNIMLGWRCTIDNVHTSLIIGENCDINTPASGALIIGQDNIVYNTSWHVDSRNRAPIFVLGKGNKIGYNTDSQGWNVANKYLIGNYLSVEGDRDPGLYVGQYNKYFYLDQNNDPVYVPYDDALLTIGNGTINNRLNSLLLDEYNQLYIQPYNSGTNNDNVYEDIDGMINVAKKLESKQDALISGTNIKTINNTSILGSGNIDIQGGVQSDWNEADSSSLAYIQNKPTIPAAPVQSDWNEVDSSSLAYIQNKPIIPVAQVQSNWNENDSTSMAYIQNKPTIPAAQVQSDWNQTDNTQVDYIKNKPTIPAAQVNADWNSNSGVSEILNKPSLATVATSGNYNDLSNLPTIPAAPVQSDWNESDTNSLAYIQNKPTIPSTTGMVTSSTNGLKIEVVNSLPSSPSNDTIYIIV